MRIRKHLLALFLIPLLTYCGFSPLYGEQTTKDFSNIEIALIPDESGVILRNYLIDRLHGDSANSNKSFILSMTPVKENITDLAITKSADATRAQMSVASTMTLSSTDGKPIIRRDLREVTSYNILASEFTNRVSKEAARKAALNGLARQAEEELVIYFSSTSLSDSKQASSPSR